MPTAGRTGVIRKEVLRFAIPGAILLLILALAGVFLSFQLAQREAIRDAESSAQLLARTAVSPLLEPGLQAGDPQVLTALDTLVRSRILYDDMMTVRIWGADGAILYSDHPELNGEKYELDQDALDMLHKGGVEAEFRNLTKPENRLAQGETEAVEVYLPVRGSDGTTYLFELYQRRGSLQSDAWRILQPMIPVVAGSLFVLAVILLMLAVRMANMLVAEQQSREKLLRRSLGASDDERRRIAAGLHDGAVQDLAGVSYTMPPWRPWQSRLGTSRPPVSYGRQPKLPAGLCETYAPFSLRSIRQTWRRQDWRRLLETLQLDSQTPCPAKSVSRKGWI